MSRPTFSKLLSYVQQRLRPSSERRQDGIAGRPATRSDAREPKLLSKWLLSLAAAKDRATSAADQAVLMIILDSLRDDGASPPGYSYLIRKTGRDRATVVRSINRLLALEYILPNAERCRGVASRFRPNFNMATAQVAARDQPSRSHTREPERQVAMKFTISGGLGTKPTAPPTARPEVPPMSPEQERLLDEYRAIEAAGWPR